MPKIIGAKTMNAANFVQAIEDSNTSLQELRRALELNGFKISYYRLQQYARGFNGESKINKIFPKNLVAIAEALDVEVSFLSEETEEIEETEETKEIEKIEETEETKEIEKIEEIEEIKIRKIKKVKSTN